MQGKAQHHLLREKYVAPWRPGWNTPRKDMLHEKFDLYLMFPIGPLAHFILKKDNDSLETLGLARLGSGYGKIRGFISSPSIMKTTRNSTFSIF